MNEIQNKEVYQGLNKLYANVSEILANARKRAYTAVNFAMVESYWLIGQQIVEHEQHGEARADYGKGLLKDLAARLTIDFGKGFDERMVKEAIANGFLLENGQKPSENGSQKRSDLTISDEKNGHKNGHKNGQEGDQEPSRKPSKRKVSKFPTPIVEEVYKAIKLNRKAKYSWLQDNLGVSETTIKRAISDLKELGFINKEHSKIKGEWQLLK